MAAQFAGKWDLIDVTNAAEMLKATGVANEFLELAKSMKENDEEVMEDISVQGNKMTIVYYKNRTKVDEDSFNIGEETESETVDGRKLKFTATVEGNKLIFKETGPFECTTIMEVKGNEASTTVVCGGVTATGKLKKL